MTVIGEVEVRVKVRLRSESHEELEQAARDLRARVDFSIPKRRFGASEIVARDVEVKIPLTREVR